MSDRAFVRSTIHVAQPEVFVEKVGGGVYIFMGGERPSMFRFMSNLSKFIGFIDSSNVRMGANFVYGESMSSLL